MGHSEIERTCNIRKQQTCFFLSPVNENLLEVLAASIKYLVQVASIFDTNQAVQPQHMARSLKFISDLRRRGNKDTDQLHSD